MIKDQKQSRAVQKDLTYRFPSKDTLRRWMEASSLLNLRHVSKLLLDPDSIITVGFDDTSKQ